MDKRKVCVSRILKMTSLFFLSCAMCAQAETVSSQSIRITLNKNNVRLENILNDIESQTNLLFIYNKNVNVNRKVSVNAENISLQEVLQNLFYYGKRCRNTEQIPGQHRPVERGHR